MINVVIPAAGAATRLNPISNNTSKAMVRVNGKPCIDYIIEQLDKHNEEIAEIMIVDGELNDIREYCSKKYGDRVSFKKQGSLDGPRDAIAKGCEQLKNKEYPLVVWLGDAIILDTNLPLGEDFLLTKTVTNQSAWCMYDGSHYYDKPTTPVEGANALVGLYSFKHGNAAVTSFVEASGYDISSALSLYSKVVESNFNQVLTNKWYDIGDLPSYHETCGKLLNLKARAFNRIEYDNDLGVLRKFPNYHDKQSRLTLSEEAYWYSQLTIQQSMFVPRVFDEETDISFPHDKNFLTLSYESGSLLSDMMLYQDISESSWDYILTKLLKVKQSYFNNISGIPNDFIRKFSANAENIWVDKTINRLKQTALFSEEEREKIISLAKEVAANTQPIQGMHGDLHFGNIIYNQTNDTFKLIDPRGCYGDKIGAFGDNIYDYAKLAQDLVYGYNAALANVDEHPFLDAIFLRKLDALGLPVDLILRGGLVLLATCIPLHYDDVERQKRFAEIVKVYLNEF